MTRKPPNNVIQILREEVGFGCPITNCGLPNLEWHHFDPPFNERNHHNPEGMIALCRDHHIQADNGAFTNEQLKKFKKSGRDNWKQTSGKFNWMRNRLLAVIGSNLTYETPILFSYKGTPKIWFERDENGYLLLNLHMIETSNKPRMSVTNNIWCNAGNEERIEFPPSAKKLKISYPNKDMVSIEYFEINSIDEAKKRYPEIRDQNWAKVELPITAVELSFVDSALGISFTPKEYKSGPGIRSMHGFAIRGGTAYSIA